MSDKKNIKINNVLVIGLGLIGASLCRSLRNSMNYEKVFGYDCNEEVTQYAINNNFIDEAKKDIKSAIKDSDLIVICVPVSQIENILDIAKEFFNTEKIFTDTMSSKNPILDFINENKLSEINNFILSHPMAGTENYGIQNSEDNLFHETVTLISPLKSSYSKNIDVVTELWNSILCNTMTVNPLDHDKYISVISHAPHFISFALSKKINDLNKINGSNYFEDFSWINSKGSLADMTRIANSDPEAWANILMKNEDNICDFIEMYINELSELKSLVKTKNFNDLVLYLKKSKPIK